MGKWGERKRKRERDEVVNTVDEAVVVVAYLEEVVSLRVEDHDALVEVVVLHGARGIEDSQGWVGFRLECIICATVVQIMAEACHQQTQDLKSCSSNSV